MKEQKNTILNMNNGLDSLKFDKYIKFYNDEKNKISLLKYNNLLDLYLESSCFENSKVKNDIFKNLFEILKLELEKELQNFITIYTQGNLFDLVKSDVDGHKQSVLNDSYFKNKDIKINENSPLHFICILNNQMVKIKMLSTMLSGIKEGSDEISLVEQSVSVKKYNFIRGYWVNNQGESTRDIRIYINFDVEKTNQKDEVDKLITRLDEGFQKLKYNLSYDFLHSNFTLRSRNTNEVYYFKNINNVQSLYKILIFSIQYERYLNYKSS